MVIERKSGTEKGQTGKPRQYATQMAQQWNIGHYELKNDQ